MATKIFRESLNGKYDGVSPKILLESGSVSGGKNMRKVGVLGGWKPRKGCTLHNTTQISAHSVKSLHRFKHPRNDDYHFIAQINSLLYDATNDPPASGTTFGTSLGVTVGTTPGFSAKVSEKLIYADGSGKPVIWQGDDGVPLGFFVYDESEDLYIEYSGNVKDKRTETKAVILAAADDKFYLLTHEPCEGFIVDLGSSVNSNSVTMTVKAWRNGAWVSVSSLSDGTASGGATLAQDGTVTWTRSTSDETRLISEVIAYAYEIGWSGALSGTVDLLEITTKEDASAITNKWDGLYDYFDGAFFYDQNVDVYNEILGKVSSEATSEYADLSSGTTSDFLYLKTLSPATVFGFAMVSGYENAGAKAVGVISITDLPNVNETLVVDDQTFTWKASRSGTGEVTIGADVSATTMNLRDAINADLVSVVAAWDPVQTLVTAAVPGTAGNSIVFTEASSNLTMNGGGTLGGSTAGTEAGLIDQLEYWDGSAWISVTTSLVDGTVVGDNSTSFARTNTFSFDASSLSPQKRVLQSDSVPGYWYRLSWDATMSANTRLYLATYAAYPEVLPTYKGCVEFKDKLFLWGDPEFPNRLRYSTVQFPDCFVGDDSGYTDSFGNMDEIIYACPFYNNLLVFKKSSIWVLSGNSPSTFVVTGVTNTIGLASPKTALVTEAGYYAIGKEDEALVIVIWQAFDGVYILSGQKIKKISLPIDQYFNPESSDCIAAANIDSLQAFFDLANNEYHLLLPTKELVYNYVTDEWYPAWERDVDLTTALSLKGTDNRDYVYGGNSSGYIFRLENDTTDKDVANADKAIDHNIISRAISVEEKQGVSAKFTLRRLWAELKARTSGTIVTTTYKNLASSGTVQATPEAMTMISSGEGISTPALDMSIQDCSCFEVKFGLNEVDKEMEIWGFLYELEARGFLDR